MGGEYMVRIAIVEDEPAERDRLRGYLERFSEETQTLFHISVFSDGVGITSSYQAAYDIIFLDIQMKIQDGLKTAELIRLKDKEAALVFITNMAQYALKGYSVSASNFVLKPVSYFAFSEVLRDELKKLARRESRSVPLKVEDGMIRLRLQDLYYAEMKNRKAALHTAVGEYAMSGTLLKLEELLNDRRFFRCHSGFLINIEHLHKIRAASVVLNPGGMEIPLSRHKKKDLEASLINFLQEQL